MLISRARSNVAMLVTTSDHQWPARPPMSRDLSHCFVRDWRQCDGSLLSAQPRTRPRGRGSGHCPGPGSRVSSRGLCPASVLIHVRLARGVPVTRGSSIVHCIVLRRHRAALTLVTRPLFWPLIGFQWLPNLLSLASPAALMNNFSSNKLWSLTRKQKLPSQSIY